MKAVVHNQGSNVQNSGILLEEDVGWESVNCTAHKLQLCINQGLEVNAIARAVAAAKKLVGHFKHSALATQKLKERQRQLELPEKKEQL